jgi:hypothetical protein
VISLVERAAIGTDPLARGEVKVSKDILADMARFRGREPLIDLHQGAPVPPGLVAKLPDELAPTHVANRLGEVGFLTMFLTARLSTQITWFSSVMRVLNCCW